MRELLAVRHGQCRLNAEHRVTGWSLEDPLTELGAEQAMAAAKECASRVRGAVRLVSSDAARALATARVIGERLGVEVERTPLAREQYLGQMEGSPRSQLRALPVPEGKDITEISWSGGETVAGLYERMGLLHYWLETTTPADTCVVLVGHGDALRALDGWLRGRGHRDLDWSFTMANGEVRALPMP